MNNYNPTLQPFVKYPYCTRCSECVHILSSIMWFSEIQYKGFEDTFFSICKLRFPTWHNGKCLSFKQTESITLDSSS